MTPATDNPRPAGEHDHLHLLVEHPPTVQLSKLVNSIQGVSSRRMRQRFGLRTQRDHLWSPSYLAASCGGATLAIIRQYVEQATAARLSTVPGSTAYRGSGYPGREQPSLRR